MNLKDPSFFIPIDLIPMTPYIIVDLLKVKEECKACNETETSHDSSSCNEWLQPVHSIVCHSDIPD